MRGAKYPGDICSAFLCLPLTGLSDLLTALYRGYFTDKQEILKREDCRTDKKRKSPGGINIACYLKNTRKIRLYVYG